MEEDKAPASSGGDPSARASSSFVRKGDRKIFAVELRPGETTIVSWKKLMKDANKVNGPASFPEHPVNAHPSLESRIAPGQPTEEDAKDAPNRFSAVIEKIERLYTGRDSSDDEDLLDIPDDDQYDTEDSFIDDAELDEYFEVDNSAIKHDGFFVNRGKLERISEALALPSQQHKKRRRKEILKDPGECFDGHGSNKDVKVGKATGKAASLLVKNTFDTPQNLAVPSEHLEGMKFQNQLDASAVGNKKKAADTRPILDPSVSLKVSSDDVLASVTEAKDVDKASITGVFLSTNTSIKYKDSNESFDSSHQKHCEKSAYVLSKSHPGRPVSNIDDLENPGQSNERNGIRELPDLNLSMGTSAMQATKSHYIHKKDGSSVRPKTSMLERAIRDLEKTVAESRPPVAENQEADTASLAVKRRLPREIKLKLAKVARLAQASQGKVSKELIIRLMSILGHLIQVRTLKRNLKIMISMGLSAKKEKDDRFQQIKKEVIELINMTPPSLESEQQAGSSCDYQECGPEDEASTKRKLSMDTALEEKICDLYDIFVDGLDEDAGPQIRKLYAELAKLWPNGHMDNHGIKRAICRAKERRKALYNRDKDQEKIKRRKTLGPWQEETVRFEASSVTSTQNMQERLASDSSSHNFTSANKPVSNTVPAVQIPSPSLNIPKQEKIKRSSNGVRASDGILTKKVRRKPELHLEETHFHPEKPGEARPESQTQSAGPSLKPSPQPTSIPGLEQSG